MYLLIRTRGLAPQNSCDVGLISDVADGVASGVAGARQQRGNAARGVFTRFSPAASLLRLH